MFPCFTRATGRPPSGDLTASPALSLRTEGTEALVSPPCTGEIREENFPSRSYIVGDEGTLTIVACATEYSLYASANPRPKDVARGFVLGPLTLDRGLNSISQPIRDRLGCMLQCVCHPGHILTVQSNQFCTVQKSRMCSPSCKIVQSKICALNFHTNLKKSYSLICCICSGGRCELATCLSYKREGCTVSANSVAGLQRLTQFPGVVYYISMLQQLHEIYVRK